MGNKNTIKALNVVEKLQVSLVNYFLRGKKDWGVTQKEVTWVAENLDSLLDVMKKQELKRLKKGFLLLRSFFYCLV